MVERNFVTNQDIILLLAQRIKEYRLAARLSQKEMAEKSGVGMATISHFEQGVTQNMSLNNFISLLRVVGMERRFKRGCRSMGRRRSCSADCPRSSPTRCPTTGVTGCSPNGQGLTT